MKPKLLLLLSGFALVLAADARASLAFVLTPAAQSGVGSNQVIFAAALTNASLTGDLLYLNDLQLSFNGGATNYLAAGTNLFFANVPGILLPDETYNDIVFGVAVNPAIPPGNYSGTATVRGGPNIFATNNLASQTFQVTLPPATLRLVAAGTNCVLSWPSPPAGFALQQNSDLTKANWVTMTNTPTVSNGWNTVIFSPKGRNYFYRLTYP
jgi:hypothetical protein